MDHEHLLDHENAERILETGWRLFQQKGYRGVSIDELCAQCQLTKPTLYYYFQDKETLFVSVLQHKLHNFRMAVEQPETLEERLQSVAKAILDSFRTEYSTLLRDREHLKKPENLQKIREAFHNELYGPLIHIMRRGVEEGELQDEDPQALTLIFLGMINNFIGKAEEMQTNNAVLAQKITHYFLEGAKKS